MQNNPPHRLPLHPFCSRLLATLCCLALLWPSRPFAQTPADTTAGPKVWEDRIYTDNIGTVEFHVVGADLALPVVRLNSGSLRFSFDDFDADVKYYYYTIQHCNKDWTPTESLSPMDYIRGFTEEEITQYDFSVRTLQPYTHYELSLPNADMGWKLSGNYILKVYGEAGPEQPYITRRFIVAEDKVFVNGRVTRATKLGKMHTHQELDFTIEHENYEIPNPKRELSVTVIQNTIWDNSYQGIEPMFMRGTELEYNYQGKIVFQGLRESRWVDLRSLGVRQGDRAGGFSRDDYGYILDMPVARPMFELPYLSQVDLNGGFVIETFDQNDPDREGDYVLVRFSLAVPFEYEKGDVYIMGKFSDWRPHPSLRMEYDAEKGLYTGSAYLKQGFYDYSYVYVPEEGDWDFGEIDGNYQQTENDYSVIVYHRPFGALYDRVVAAQIISSAPQ